VQWAGKPTESGRNIKAPSKITDVVNVGDVILVDAQKNTKTETYNIRQVPDVNGGIVAMDPHTGRVLALHLLLSAKMQMNAVLFLKKKKL